MRSWMRQTPAAKSAGPTQKPQAPEIKLLVSQSRDKIRSYMESGLTVGTWISNVARSRLMLPNGDCGEHTDR